MSEREELANLINEHAYGRDGLALSAADAILASDWLAAHDARIREDVLGPVRALVTKQRNLYATMGNSKTVLIPLDELIAVIDTPAQADGEVGK